MKTKKNHLSQVTPHYYQVRRGESLKSAEYLTKKSDPIYHMMPLKTKTDIFQQKQGKWECHQCKINYTKRSSIFIGKN